MLFKKSNKFYKENIKIRDYVRGMGKEEVCLTALLYIEYRLKYYKADKEKVSGQCALASSIFFNRILDHILFVDEFLGISEFSYRMYSLSRKNAWESLECIINNMCLDSGFTGGMGYQRKAEIIRIFKVVLEKYFELPLSKIIKEVRNQ